MRSIFLLLPGLLLLLPLFARDVYVNGVKVDGLKNQKFENCTVEFDKDGNVRITAPGVKIMSEDNVLAKRYYFVLNLNSPAKSPIKVLINKKEVTTLNVGETSIPALDINKFLIKGENEVTVMIPIENAGAEVTIIAGTGTESGGQIAIEPIFVEKKTVPQTGLAFTKKVKVE